MGGRGFHAGGRRVEGGLGCFLGFGGLLSVRGLCPCLVGGAERVPRGGRGGAGGGDDLVEGGGQRRGDRAEEGLGVLGVGLQGGGDNRGRGVGCVEGDPAVCEEDRAVGGGRDLGVRGRDDDRAARVREGPQEGAELFARGGGQGDRVFDEEDLGAGHDRAGDEGLEALPLGELRGAQVDALGEARDLQGSHEVIPVGDGARRGQGGQDVLADRQGLVERGVGADQRDRANAAREACGQRARGRGDDAAGLRLLEAREDQEEGAGAAARRVQDRAQRAGAEAQVNVGEEDRAGHVVRVGDAQAGDLDAAAAALRGEGTARAVPGARRGGRQVDGGGDGVVGVRCRAVAGGVGAVGGREFLGGLVGLGLRGCGLGRDVAGGLRGGLCCCGRVGGERGGGGLGLVGCDEGGGGHEGLLQVLRAVVGERFCGGVGGGGVGLVGGAAEDLLERREGAALGGRLVGGVGGGRGGSLGAGAGGVGRHVGQLLAVRAMQVFTRVIRHAPIVSGSRPMCRSGARKWVGWPCRKVLADVACISETGEVGCKRLIPSKSRLVSGSECSTASQ